MASWNGKPATAAETPQTLYVTGSNSIGITQGNEISLPTSYPALSAGVFGCQGALTLMGNSLTAASGVLYINGNAIGTQGSQGDVSQWAGYLASQNVNMNTNNVNNFTALNGEEAYLHFANIGRIATSALAVTGRADIEHCNATRISCVNSAYAYRLDAQTAGFNSATVQNLSFIVADGTNIESVTAKVNVLNTTYIFNSVGLHSDVLACRQLGVDGAANMAAAQIDALQTINIRNSERITTVDLTVTGAGTLLDATVTGTLTAANADITDVTVAGNVTTQNATVTGTLNATTAAITNLGSDTANVQTLNAIGAINLSNVGDGADINGSYNTSVVHGNQYINDLNNMRNGQFNTLNIVSMWNGDEVFPPYQTGATLTVGDDDPLTLQSNAVVTINGLNNIYDDALTVNGSTSLRGGVKCYPLNLGLNALDVYGLSYLNGSCNVTGDLNVTGVAEFTGQVNILGNISMAAAAECLATLNVLGALTCGGDVTIGLGTFTCTADVSIGRDDDTGGNCTIWFPVDVQNTLDVHNHDLRGVSTLTMLNADDASRTYSLQARNTPNSIVGPFNDLYVNGVPFLRSVSGGTRLLGLQVAEFKDTATTDTLWLSSWYNDLYISIRNSAGLPERTEAVAAGWSRWPALADVNLSQKNLLGVGQAAFVNVDNSAASYVLEARNTPNAITGPTNDLYVNGKPLLRTEGLGTGLRNVSAMQLMDSASGNNMTLNSWYDELYCTVYNSAGTLVSNLPAFAGWSRWVATNPVDFAGYPIQGAYNVQTLSLTLSVPDTEEYKPVRWIDKLAYDDGGTWRRVAADWYLDAPDPEVDLLWGQSVLGIGTLQVNLPDSTEYFAIQAGPSDESTPRNALLIDSKPLLVDAGAGFDLLNVNGIVQNGVRTPVVQWGSASFDASGDCTVGLPVAYVGASDYVVTLTMLGSAGMPYVVPGQGPGDFTAHGPPFGNFNWTTTGNVV